MKLTPINSTRLTLLESGQFINRQLTDIEVLGSAGHFNDEILSGYLTSMRRRMEDFNDALMPVRKNTDTIKIEEQDSKRDQALSVFRKALAVFELSEDTAELDAARSLVNLFRTYKNLHKLNYAAETSGIDHLLNDLNSSKYAAHVELLGLGRYVTRLHDSNDLFKTLFGSRSQETAQKETFDAKLLRKEMFSAYNEFAAYVLVMANVNVENSVYAEVLNALNGARKYFADLLARRKGVAAKAV